MLHHRWAFQHGFVVEHLSCQRYGGDRCLKLVRHVVDEVVFDFAQLLLTENHHNGVDENEHQNEREHKRRYHKLDRCIDVTRLRREKHLQHIALRFGVFREQHCRKYAALIAIRLITGCVIHDALLWTFHRKFVWHFQTVALQFPLQVDIHPCRIGTLHNGAVARLVENG